MARILKDVVFADTPSQARRVAYFAHAFVLFSLLALLIVPVSMFRQTETLRREINVIADPARSLIDDVEIALAREVSAIRGWLLTGDESFRGFFYGARDDADEAFAALEPLVAQLGPAARHALADLRTTESEWLVPNLDALGGALSASELERQIPTQQQRYVSTIAAAKRLTQAINLVVEQRRDDIREATRLSVYATALLSVLALLSMVTIFWNGYRWRTIVSNLRDAVDELAEQAERAKAAVRTRDEVLAIVSHDLRTPLTAIEISATNLRSQVPTAFHKRQLDIITRSVDRTNRLIADILDVSRIEAGRKLSIEPQFLDVHPLVESMTDTFGPQANERLQEFVVDVPANLPRLYADRDRLAQVLSNLIGNAVKFTPDGGRISVDVRETVAGIEFSVSDTGPGITESDTEHIFDPYWQVQRTARLGTGLGLTIAKGIVDGHGGSLHVESTPGVGSTFSFTLPGVGCRKIEGICV